MDRWETNRLMRASIGPRADARGNRRTEAYSARHSIASIGPRADARGNSIVVVDFRESAGASIGPRADARGNTQDMHIMGSMPNGLQLGHALTRVETMSESENKSENKYIFYLASLGHALTRVETQTIRLPGCHACSASIGPRADARGNDYRMIKLALKHYRFNWATR